MQEGTAWHESDSLEDITADNARWIDEEGLWVDRVQICGIEGAVTCVLSALY